jgi:hypothetical protein
MRAVEMVLVWSGQAHNHNPEPSLRSVGLAQAKAQLTALLDAVESEMEETSYLLRSTALRRATDLFRRSVAG